MVTQKQQLTDQINKLKWL